MYPDSENMPGFTPPVGPPANILVVEDEVLIRLDVAEHLRQHEFQVFEAASPEEAQTIIQSGAAIDIVFSDIHMPNPHDGIILALWIAEHRPSVDLIVTSGVEASLLEAQTACQNVVALISKPYRPDQVLSEIRTALQARAVR